MTVAEQPGPRPVPPGRHDELGETRRRVLELLSDAGPAGAGVADVASSLGGHPNRARAHLDALVADGLAAVERAAPSGRGRPALRYRVVAAGRRALAGGAHADYRSLSAAFARHLAASGDADAAREVGRLWAETMPIPQPDEDASDAGRVQRLVDLLSWLDFSPVLVPDDQGAVIRLQTCPFVEEARDNPEVICSVHRGLLDVALAEPGGEVSSSLQPFVEPGACRILLRRRAAASDA